MVAKNSSSIILEFLIQVQKKDREYWYPFVSRLPHKRYPVLCIYMYVERSVRGRSSSSLLVLVLYGTLGKVEATASVI